MFTYQKFIKETFQYHKQLNPTFWVNYQFNERIRQKLLTIAYEFYDQINLKCPILDIILIGSIANFNYTEASDLDVHVVVDLSIYGENMEIIKDFVKDRKILWNLKHNIKIKGYEVEIYVEDVSDPRESLGQFSLLKNEWLVKPERQNIKLDVSYINDKYNTFVSGIEILENYLKRQMSPERAKDFYKSAKTLVDRIVKMRKYGLAKSGEFSSENIIWKLLKHKGWVDKLFDIIDGFYDKIFIQ